MADNWLEKRERQLRCGRVVYRKDNPSLETLLHSVAGGNAVRPGAVADKVKSAQLAAIVRSASILFPTAGFSYDETGGAIDLAGCSLDTEQLGEAILAMRLKACELGFNAVLRGDLLLIGR